MKFGLIIGFIEHLQVATTRNYNAIANSNTLQFTTTRTKSSQSAVSSPVVSWYRLLTMDIPLIVGSRTLSQCLIYQLLSNTLTHQPTLHFPELHCTDLTSQTGAHLIPASYSSDTNSTNCSSQLFPLITSRHGPRRKHCSSLL
jgi:hypothetical protein